MLTSILIFYTTGHPFKLTNDLRVLDARSEKSIMILIMKIGIMEPVTLK